MADIHTGKGAAKEPGCRRASPQAGVPTCFCYERFDRFEAWRGAWLESGVVGYYHTCTHSTVDTMV